METIARERLEIELLLEENPSLRGEVSSLVPAEMARAGRYAVQALRRHGEATPEVLGKITAAAYTEEQVLADWFPGDAPHPVPLPAGGERE